MLLYLYGPDSYRRGQKLQELVLIYEKKYSGLSLRRFDLEEKDEEGKLLEFLSAQSLFDPARMAIVSGVAETGKKFGETLRPFFEDKKTTVVVLADKKLGKDFAWLQDADESFSFDFLEGPEFLAWAEKMVKQRGLTLSRSELAPLLNVYAKDSWGLTTELEVIALGRKIEGARQVPDFFPLVQRLKAASPLAYRLTALAHLLEHEDPGAVFNIAAALMPPQAKAVMANYDVAVKSGKLEYEEVLLDFVLSS
jgi:hypothetical protein